MFPFEFRTSLHTEEGRSGLVTRNPHPWKIRIKSDYRNKRTGTEGTGLFGEGKRRTPVEQTE